MRPDATAGTNRRLLLAGLAGLALPRRPRSAEAALEPVLERARSLERLRTLIIAGNGRILVEHAFRGPPPDRPVNVKSVAKSVISALVGIAIERGLLQGVEQPIAPILRDRLPKNPDPRLARITVGHLLSMRAGLERTSGANYGRWVSSRDWVRFALSRPFVDEPGGRMLYSTGSSHLLSAILTKASGKSTLQLAREWLGQPLGIAISSWTRDPQGIYFGGNEMALSPRALLRFGEMYRQDGRIDGGQVVPEAWIGASWQARTSSPFTGHSYGYGWFVAQAGSHPVYYAWGYGGQMLYVLPDLALTVVITSDADHPSGRDGYVRVLHGLLAEEIVPAVERASP
ncbi:MAG TPA: serine hydrolase [Geminicoccaceae bacterium]|nr:serine hydrolase [Geminicoccus sp.]HMU48251.1 serine hydrolase [Geminicoccaceae bacterium]